MSWLQQKTISRGDYILGMFFMLIIGFVFAMSMFFKGSPPEEKRTVLNATSAKLFSIEDCVKLCEGD